MQIEQLGPYRLGRPLGKGGMGTVFAAQDPAGHAVAVKALAPQLAMAEGFRERFEAEIETLKKLQHEGIVRLFGYGEERGVLFYSMELVDGPSLEQELASGRRFDWQETLAIAIQVCRALKHAHDHGIIHRDVKPANLLLAEGQRVKIADFGIARLFGSTQLTTAGGVLGTADYMSPEQADGRPVTDKVDQYALGCVMYALLAGRPPFRASTMPEMLQLQRFAEPEPVRRFAPQTPEQLDKLIRQLLSKDPDKRFPNVQLLGRHMEAMAKALARGPRDEPVESPTTPPTPADATAVSRGTDAVDAADLLPLETTDSGVYDAPTMADPNLAPKSPPTAPQGAAATQQASYGSLAWESGPAKFTTVAEAAAREAAASSAERWTLLWQLALLGASLVAVAWLGWRLMRPPTATELYERIIAAVAAEGSDALPGLADEIEEFLARYDDDPRGEEVRMLQEELDLVRAERRLNARLRTGRGADGAMSLIENTYLEAVALESHDLPGAVRRLESLRALFGRPGDRTTLSPGDRQLLSLAQRRLDRLRTLAGAQQTADLQALEERLAFARRLEQSSPTQAVAAYRALVDLSTGKPWADGVAAEARARLDVLGAAPAAGFPHPPSR